MISLISRLLSRTDAARADHQRARRRQFRALLAEDRISGGVSSRHDREGRRQRARANEIRLVFPLARAMGLKLKLKLGGGSGSQSAPQQPIAGPSQPSPAPTPAVVQPAAPSPAPVQLAQPTQTPTTTIPPVQQPAKPVPRLSFVVKSVPQAPRPAPTLKVKPPSYPQYPSLAGPPIKKSSTSIHKHRPGGPIKKFKSGPSKKRVQSVASRSAWDGDEGSGSDSTGSARSRPKAQNRTLGGTQYRLVDEQLVLPDDPLGEAKIDRNGNLLGGA